MGGLQKLKLKLLYDLAISPLGIHLGKKKKNSHLKWYMHPNIHSKSGPCTPNTKLNLGDRVLGEVEKNRFFALPGKEGHSGLTSSKLCPDPKRVVRSFTVMFQKGMISLWTFFWLADGEISGSQHQWLWLVWGIHACEQHAVNLSHLVRGFPIWQTALRYCYVYTLRGNQDPVPGLHHFFLHSFSLASASTPSPD